MGASTGSSASIAFARALPPSRGVVMEGEEEERGRRLVHRSVMASRAFLARADLCIYIRMVACLCTELNVGSERGLPYQSPPKRTSGSPPDGPRPAPPAAPQTGRSTLGGARPAAASHQGHETRPSSLHHCPRWWPWPLLPLPWMARRRSARRRARAAAVHCFFWGCHVR